MFNKKLMVLVILLVSILSISAVNAADNTTGDVVSVEDATDEVASINDNKNISDENTLGASTGTFTDLANDIKNAKNTLNLNRDYKYNPKTDNMGYNNGVGIDKSITINGNGHTINGNNQMGALQINNEQCNVVLNNINFVNCTKLGEYSSTGAIYISANYVDTFSMKDCTFENCHGTIGGAIAIIVLHADISGCRFIDCSAHFGGAIWMACAEGSIYDCSFMNCIVSDRTGDGYSESGTGGAIRLIGDNIVMSDCSFIGCSAKGDGGAIHLEGDNNDLSNCSFENCSVSESHDIFDDYHGGDGGAIYFHYGENNTLSDCIFIGCSANGDGGSIYWNGNNGLLSNCNFLDCYSKDGGAVYWNSLFDDGHRELIGLNGTLFNCSFVNCSALGHYEYYEYQDEYGEYHEYPEYINSYGGAVYWSGSNGTLSQCDFENCFADNGGAIYWNSFYDEILDYDKIGYVDYNEIGYVTILFGVNGTLSNCNFKNCSANDAGGAVYWSSSNGTLSQCDFENCFADNGGAVYWNSFYELILDFDTWEDILVWFGVNGTLSNCNFKNCSSEENGGAIHWKSANSTVFNSSFANCRAKEYGGGIYFNSTNCSLVNSTFDGNSAKKGEDWYSEYPLNVTINKKSTVLSAPDVCTTYGVSKNLTVTLKDDKNNPVVGEQIDITLNSAKYSLKTNSQGQVSLAIPTSLAPKTYTAAITYKGNTKYNSSSTTANVIVDKANTNISIAYDKQSNELTATLTNADGDKTIKGATIVVTVNGAKYSSKTDANGQVIMSTADWADGKYTATATYNGNSMYNPTNTTQNIIIGKVNTSISMDYNWQSKEILVTLNNVYEEKVISGASVTVNINGVKYANKTDSNGQIRVSVAGLDDGKYTATASYKGNSKYNPTSASINITIGKIDTSLVIEDVFAEYDNVELTATLINEDTGKGISNANVRFEINGEKYTVKTNSTGEAKLTISGLAPGDYTATVSYNGNSKYKASAETANIIVNKVTTSISVYYDSTAHELVATLINTQTGKGISNANIVFNLNGVKTSVKTNKQGEARFAVKDTTDLTSAGVRYGGNSKYLYSTATCKVQEGKIPTVISLAYDKESSSVVTTLTNAETGKAISGATVVFNFNKVKTSVKTNKLGQAMFSFANLDQAVYYIGSSYGGNSKYAGSTTATNIVKI